MEDAVLGTEPPPIPSTPVDYFLGILYVLCLATGVPANIIAFTYFKNQTKDLSTSLYMIITTVDLLLCGGASIVAANFFAQRQGLLFSFSWYV